MTLQSGDVDDAARALIERHGGREAIDVASRRAAAVEKDGMGPAHTAALLLLSAVERQVGAKNRGNEIRPAGHAGGPFNIGERRSADQPSWASSSASSDTSG
jgi:hypothetical protein